MNAAATDFVSIPKTDLISQVTSLEIRAAQYWELAIERDQGAAGAILAGSLLARAKELRLLLGPDAPPEPEILTRLLRPPKTLAERAREKGHDVFSEYRRRWLVVHEERAACTCGWRADWSVEADILGDWQCHQQTIVGPEVPA